MNPSDVLNYPEVHTFIGVLLTALAAWIKRKMDLKKINEKHRLDLQDLRDAHAAELLEKEAQVNTPPAGTRLQA